MTALNSPRGEQYLIENAKSKGSLCRLARFEATEIFPYPFAHRAFTQGELMNESYN